MIRIHPEARFRIATNVHVRRLEADLVLLDFARGEYYALDAIGAELWDDIARGASIGEMVAALVVRYDVPEATATRDAAALVMELLERSLIEPSPHA